MRPVDRSPACEDTMNTFIEAHPERHLPPVPTLGLPAERWTPLAWTPFQVRYAPDAEAAANAVALAIHRAREVLARRLRVTVPVRVLVVDGPCVGAQSLRPESTLWIPSEPCAGWTEL